jgi:phosphoribosylaminoimidazole carboxylase (NCAIR synthetase)
MASGIQVTSKYYDDLRANADIQTNELGKIDEKNIIIFDKEKIQNQLLNEIESKEKLLLTRSRMLQISQDRNSYKKQLIYSFTASAFIILILVIFIYYTVKKKKA